MALPALVEPAAELSRDEIARYSRHLIIPDVAMDGQKRLKNARVLLIGAGGLGAPNAMYLAAAGVGHLGLVDFDVVDLGLVYGVDQEDEGRKVRLDMTLTTVACPLTDMIEGATNAALIGLDDIQEVEINWVWSPPWGPERLTEDGKMALRAMGFAI